MGYAGWLARSSLPRARAAWASGAGPRHLLFAFCDHYQPLARQFRDADGRSPRHSFFFPGEEYETGYLDGLAALAAGGFGEVELHLHHDGDTAAGLRDKIAEYLDLYARHGHLSRDA